MPTLEKYLGKVYLWKYVPSLPLAITFTAIFALATIAHTYKMVKTRMWFCVPFVIGGVCEVVGYASRALACNATGAMAPYLSQAIFLLLPPIFFAASLYMVYSRVVRAVHGDRFSLITPRWTTRFFVLGDLITLQIQSAGANLLPKPKLVNMGNIIIVAGLGLQVAIFLGFIVVCVVFHRRLRRHEKGPEGVSEIPWQQCLNMLYATSMLILVRNVFRIIEFVEGQDGLLLRTEWTTYAFDGALMLAVMVGFYIWYPSQLQIPSQDVIVELTSNDASLDEERDKKHEYWRWWKAIRSILWPF